MELPILNIAGETVDQMELPAGIFEAKVNNGLMHQALVRQLANGRRGNHKAKGRSEVHYSTAKIYRQKGTGRARHGSRRAPIFVGGGVAHGPLPRDYSKKMPRKMRRAALRSALSAKAGAGDIVLVDRLEMDRPKTKEMVAAMQRLVGESSALVLLAERDENIELSARNIPSVKTLNANYLNIRDLLGYGKLVIPLSAMEVIALNLGREGDEWSYDYDYDYEDEDEDVEMDFAEAAAEAAEVEAEAEASTFVEDEEMAETEVEASTFVEDEEMAEAMADVDSEDEAEDVEEDAAAWTGEETDVDEEETAADEAEEADADEEA